MEWLWQVSENDEPLGKVERVQAHENLIRHRSGIVFLLDPQNLVYLTQRAASKPIFPSCFDTSASFHVAYGESYEQAADREALEELGLSNRLTLIGKFSHCDPPESQFVTAFVMEYQGDRIRLDPTEASSGGFYSLAEAARIAREEARTPWLRDGMPLLAAWASAASLNQQGSRRTRAPRSTG